MPRGGKRRGAGRKPGVSRYLTAESARQLLEQLDWKSELVALYKAEKPPAHRLQILSMLADRAHGKPAQQKELPNDSKDAQTRVLVNFVDDSEPKQQKESQPDLSVEVPSVKGRVQ